MDSRVALLTRAIRGRRVMAGRYGTTGADGVRVFYPHVLFRTRAGELVVDAFQVDGATSTGRPPMWRLFKLDGLHELEIRDGVFLPLPQLDLASSRYRGGIIAHCLEADPPGEE